MDNYKEMYIALFKKISEIIAELQEIQQQTEEMYIQMNDPEPAILKTQTIIFFDDLKNKLR